MPQKPKTNVAFNNGLSQDLMGMHWAADLCFLLEYLSVIRLTE